MKLNDKVYHERTGKTGFIDGDAFYKVPPNPQPTNSVMTLVYPVSFSGSYNPVYVEASELRLEETPQVSAFMNVQISMHADMYWGMRGIVTECNEKSAYVKIFGYQKPVYYHLEDIEPISKGSDLECWLDSLSLVKEY